MTAASASSLKLSRFDWGIPALPLANNRVGKVDCRLARAEHIQHGRVLTGQVFGKPLTGRSAFLPGAGNAALYGCGLGKVNLAHGA